MDCQQINSMLSPFADGHVVEAERRMVSAHLRSCPDCARRFEQLSAVRDSLRSLNPRQLPPRLAMSLRVIASKEAARRRRYEGLVGQIEHWTEHFLLHINNLMRPLAVPAAGGFLSAVLLFGAVMTNFQGIVRAHTDDVPTILFTGANVKSSLDFTLTEGDVVVDVFVDEQGRVIDYSFPEGYTKLNTSSNRRNIENSLLFTRFEPATTFGKPTAGWVRVSLRKSEIDVKG